MASGWSAAARRTAWMSLAVVLGGCASQAYDPVPPSSAPLYELRYETALTVEAAYRRLYTRLQACAGTGQHVQPRFEHDPEQAWIMLVSGLGLDRYSFVVNRFEARFQVDPGPRGSRVVVTWVDDETGALARASREWLLRDASGCRA